MKVYKSFISILGTNDYLECRHSFGEKPTDVPVKYCQEDIIKLFCKNFDQDSEIRIFLTETAEKTNWNDDGHLDKKTNSQIQNKGLKKRLEELNLKAKIVPVRIKEGYSENEIWEIFQVIFETFREGEEVIVDITHSFRSLPMLMITLLNYAKQVKRIKVNGIFYAAFEYLGKIEEVRKIPVNDRVAPILNLTSFSLLQDWTNATFDFVNNGSIKQLKKLAKRRKNKNERKSLESNLSSDVLVEIDKIIDYNTICRGKSLMEYDFNSLKEKILELKKIENNTKALNPLIDKFYDKLKGYNDKGINNVLYSVEWCFKHNLFQQSITLLLETIISCILQKLNLEVKERNYRLIVSSSFTIKNKNIKEDKWTGVCKDLSNITKKVLALDFIDDIKDDFEYLSEIRNDINHAGFSGDPFAPDAIKSRLQNSLKRIIPRLKEFIKS